MPEFNYYNPEVHDAMTCYCKHVVHAMINTNVEMMRISYNPRILNQQGVVTYMLPVEAFATVIKIFKWQKVCLIVPSKALGSLIFLRLKGQIGAMCS